MKYFTSKLKVKKKERKELLEGLTTLDRVLLEKAKKGSDIVGLISCGKPYINKYGGKEFATTDKIMQAVDKLVRKGFLERR